MYFSKLIKYTLSDLRISLSKYMSIKPWKKKPNHDAPVLYMCHVRHTFTGLAAREILWGNDIFSFYLYSQNLKKKMFYFNTDSSVSLEVWRKRKNLFVRMFEWVPTVWLSFNRKSLLIVKVFSSPAIWLIWWNNFLANFFSVHTSEIQIHFF